MDSLLHQLPPSVRRVYYNAAQLARKHVALIILVVATINVIFIGGKRRCFGVFLAAFHDNFTQEADHNLTVSKTELNWIGDSYGALGFFLISVATTVILKFEYLKFHYQIAMAIAAVFVFTSCISTSLVSNPAEMFFTHTVLHGIGSTLILSTCALIVADYFDTEHRWHVLATTLVTGGPIGSLIFCPLYAAWINAYGWRLAFRYIGILFFLEIGLAALTFKAKDAEYEDLDADQLIDGHTPQQKSRTQGKKFAFVSWEEMKTKPQIGLFMAERTLHNIIMYSMTMNLTDYAKDKLITSSPEDASNIQLAFSVGENIVYFAGAITGDKIRGFLPFAYLIGSYVLSVILTIWQFQMGSFGLQLFFAGIAGGAIGSGNTFLYTAAVEITKVHGAIAYPVTQFSSGLGMVLAPEFSGLIIDWFGYSGFFIVQGVLAACRMVMLVGINWCLMSQDKKEREERLAAEAEQAEQAEVQQEDDELLPGAESLPLENRDNR